MQNRRNTITPLAHVHVAPSGEHNDCVLVDRADLPDQLVLSARQLKGSVKTFTLRLWIKSYADDHGVSLRCERFGFAANGSLGSSNAETNDGTPNRLEIFEADFVGLARFQMSAIGIDGLGMTLPVIDHGVVADIEPNPVVDGSKEFVVSGFLRHEISCPANREMIDRLVRSKTSLSPIEVDMLVGAHQCRTTPQFFIAKVFSFQTAIAAGRNNKLGVLKNLVERRRVDRVQDSGFYSQTIADAFQIADRIERFGFSTAASTGHCGVSIRTNYRNRLHFAFIERKQVAGILQQNHARSGHFKGNLPALLAVGRNVGIR